MATQIVLEETGYTDATAWNLMYLEVSAQSYTSPSQRLGKPALRHD